MPARRDVDRAPQTIILDQPLMPGFVGVAMPLVDAASILVSGLLARLAYIYTTGIPVALENSLGVSVLLAALFTALMRGWGLYDGANILALERQIRSACAGWFASLAVMLTAVFLLKAGHDLSRGSMIVLSGIGLASLLGHRAIWRAALAKAFAKGLLRQRSAIVLSLVPWPAATSQLQALEAAGLTPAQRVFLPASERERAAILRGVIGRLREDAVDEIVLIASSDVLGTLEEVVAPLRAVPIPVRLVPDAALSRLALQPRRRAGRFALIDIKREPLGATELATKRALDIAVAGLALLVAAPLLVLAMIAVALESPGPVLFRQTRRGFNGRTFLILKLRTMHCLDDGDTIAQATRGDPRVTRVGEWLRRTSIDELPQLWNVLRGEMSVVGPRPHAVAHDSYYDRLIENYAFRQHVKPGLTGWAQVHGLRGETPEVSMMAARVEHDIWYVNNWSFFLDLRILLLTAARLLAKTAY